MATNARHRRPSRGQWIPVIVSGLLGVALGAGGVDIVSPDPGAQQATTPQQAATVRTPPPPAPAETAALGRTVGPVAFAPPATNAAGMSVTVLRPEKVPGGVRLTIALANANDSPITVDTGALGPRDPRFNGETVPMRMTSARKKLVPGEGYSYQCVIKLPTMDVGRLEFDVGPVSVSGMAAGD